MKAFAEVSTDSVDNFVDEMPNHVLMRMLELSEMICIKNKQ